MPAPKVSNPADFAAQRPIPFELPYPQNGKRLVILLRPVEMVEMWMAEGGARALGGEQTPDETALQEMAYRFRNIAEKAIVEPAFSFGEAREDGKAWWGDLLPGNQTAVALAAYRLSGAGVSPDLEAATRAASFPAEPGGRQERAAADPAMQPATAAAS